MRQRSSKGSDYSENVNADTPLLSTMRQCSSKGSNPLKMSILTLLYCQQCKDLITLKNVNADTTLLSTMWQCFSKDLITLKNVYTVTTHRSCGNIPCHQREVKDLLTLNIMSMLTLLYHRPCGNIPYHQ